MYTINVKKKINTDEYYCNDKKYLYICNSKHKLFNKLVNKIK